MAFVHLHVHSQYSLLDGTMDTPELAAAVARHGMKAVALTDSSNLFGAVAFFKDCKALGIHPIVGAELHVQPEGIAHVEATEEGGGYQVLALVEDDEGYKNLCQLITRAIFDGIAFKPRVDLDLLRKHAAGLVFLTGGRKGAFGRPLLAGDEAKARKNAQELASFLGPDRLYFELVDLGLPGDERVTAMARELSTSLGRELVVTNAVHYEGPEDCTVHELLNAIAMGASMADSRRIQSPTDQAYLKSEAEIRELWPDDGEAIERTVAIAERCHFKYVFDKYHFPAAIPPDPALDADTVANWAFFYRAFPPPRDFGLPDPTEAIPEKPPGAGNLNGYFEWYSRRGLELRLPFIAVEKYPSYYERLELELKMIEQMGFPAYLLIVAEFINWSKDNGIPVGPGRGSAAGSLVAYAMRITDIDPLQFDLLFERFLNPARVSMPDIDVDFCQDRREEAIQHVRQKYGEDLVSQIITYGKLKAKAAVRDVARALDLSFNEADTIAKLVPEALGITLKEAVEQVEQLQILRAGDPRVRRVLNLAEAVEGICRQTGVHAAGVVIADRPLVEYAPLYRDEPGGVPAVQYDMKAAELIGLIKFDFLGLKTLDQIRDASIMIEQNHGTKIDISRIPIDDALTFDLLQKGDGLGVFQLESSGMRELLTRLKPSSLDDLIALVALYRPGPLSSGMVDDFVDRKHGRKQVEYPLPVLEPILRGTYGTIVYQEQVMQCAQVMAGFSLGEADLLRRAMGKKKADEMAKQKARFVSGSVGNGIAEQKAVEIFELLEKFAAYGFNKSHSAAYGYISYQTAWLKAHYRPEYMAALMTIDAGDTDKVLQYIEDCRAAGLRIEPVDLNLSGRAFQAVPGQPVIRVGLAAVKGLGDAAVGAILDARVKAGGRFAGATEFFEHVDHKRINKKVVEVLAKSGAFDFLGVPRSAMLHAEGLERAMLAGQRAQEDKAAGQFSLFSGLVKGKPPPFRFPDVREGPISQKLADEKEVLGLYFSGHPMQAWASDARRLKASSTLDAKKAAIDTEVRLLAVPAADPRVVRTKRGDRMAFVRLEDQFGVIEAVFFSEPWARSQKAINTGLPVLVVGRIEAGRDGRDEEPKLLATSAELMSDVRMRSTNEVRFNLQIDELSGERLERFHALLRDRRGACRARVVLRRPGRYEAELDLPNFPVDPGIELEEKLLDLFGRSDVVQFQ